MIGPSDLSREGCLAKILLWGKEEVGGRVNVGTAGTEIVGGALASRVLRLGLGPNVAPAGWGVALYRVKLRANGEGGGIERSRVVDLRTAIWSMGSMDMDARDTPRDGGNGISAASMGGCG